MNVRVYIERLILDGVAVPYGQRPQLQAAVEAELGRLLAAGGLASGLAQGAALPAVAGGSIQLAQANEPLILGRQIARTAYAAIGMLETSRSGQTRRA